MSFPGPHELPDDAEPLERHQYPPWVQFHLDLMEAKQAGRQEGLLSAGRECLFQVLRARFGVVSGELHIRILRVTKFARLRDALVRALHVTTPDELTL
jgi:hypothetical protein